MLTNKACKDMKLVSTHFTPKIENSGKYSKYSDLVTLYL